MSVERSLESRHADEALARVHDGLVFLMGMERPLGLNHDAFVRTADHLIQTIVDDRAAHKEIWND